MTVVLISSWHEKRNPRKVGQSLEKQLSSLSSSYFTPHPAVLSSHTAWATNCATGSDEFTQPFVRISDATHGVGSSHYAPVTCLLRQGEGARCCCCVARGGRRRICLYHHNHQKQMCPKNERGGTLGDFSHRFSMSISCFADF